MMVEDRITSGARDVYVEKRCPTAGRWMETRWPQLVIAQTGRGRGPDVFSGKINVEGHCYLSSCVCGSDPEYLFSHSDRASSLRVRP